MVDTNVLVSALLRPRGTIGRVIRELRDRRFVAIVSRPILEELTDVLARPKLRDKYGLTTLDVETTLRFLILRSELVAPTVSVRACRDPADDKFLEAALAGAADCIVTGDSDLLDLNAYEGIQIVSPADFLARLDD